MGCFDTLYFICPACNKITTCQSKADECLLREFSINEAPLTIILDVENDSKRGNLYCDYCEEQLELKVQYIVNPVLKNKIRK